MAEDPYVSAVVHLATSGDDGDEPSVEERSDVGEQGEAILAGGSPAPVSQRRHADPQRIPVPDSGSSANRARGYFTSAGFEVHAPLGATFSIGAPRSRFEGFFASRLVIDEDRLGAPMTTESGAEDLPLERLPSEVRRLVGRIALPQPPDLPGFS